MAKGSQWLKAGRKKVIQSLTGTGSNITVPVNYNQLVLVALAQRITDGVNYNQLVLVALA